MKISVFLYESSPRSFRNVQSWARPNKSTKGNQFHWDFLKITWKFSITEIYFNAFEQIYDQCLDIRFVHRCFYLQITDNIVKILKNNSITDFFPDEVISHTTRAASWFSRTNSLPIEHCKSCCFRSLSITWSETEDMRSYILEKFESKVGL